MIVLARKNLIRPVSKASYKNLKRRAYEQTLSQEMGKKPQQRRKRGHDANYITFLLVIDPFISWINKKIMN